MDDCSQVSIQYCMNQLNAVEKGAQVQMMGQIYKHAEQVICDLGQAVSSPNPPSTCFT